MYRRLGVHLADSDRGAHFEDGSRCPDNNDGCDVSEELLNGQDFQHGSIVSPLAWRRILVLRVNS